MLMQKAHHFPKLFYISELRGKRRCSIRQLLIFGLFFLLCAGCGSMKLMNRSPSAEEQVGQVMQKWAEGWAALDSEILAPLISESYFGANGESKEEVLHFVREWKQNPANRILYHLDSATTEVKENGEAIVHGVQADVTIPDSNIDAKYHFEYFLKLEEGVWKVTGAVLSD